MCRTRINVDIMGRSFNIVGDKKSEYLLSIAREVDAKMKELRNENPNLMYDTAAILTALNFCDELFMLKNEKERKAEAAEEEAESNLIRSQLVEYSKELSRATNTIKKLEREIEKMKKENKEQQERVKKEYEAKEKEILDMLDSM